MDANGHLDALIQFAQQTRFELGPPDRLELRFQSSTDSFVGRGNGAV
jgi:hypothetical protein